MKKNNNILLIIALIIASFASCTDLDEIVYSEVAVSEFGSTPEQVDALVASIYSTLKFHVLSWDSYTCRDELAGDMMAIPGFKGGDWGEPMFREAMQHTWDASSTGYDAAYNYPTSSISLCNQIYYMIETSPGISEEIKVRFLSEIRGVRAFWYYILCDQFGNVPIVTDFLDRSQPETSQRSEVYNFIINELNEIKDNLRSDVPGLQSYGRFTKGAAYALLAKMYLNAEVYNPEGGPKWDECIEACDNVMALPYVLEGVWKKNFTPDNHLSEEAILSAAFKAGGSGIENIIGLNTLHYLDPIALGLNISPWNGIAANPDYVKAFDTLDIRYEGSFLTGPMIDPVSGEVLVTSHGRPLIHTVDMVLNEVGSDGWGWINQEEGARVAKWDYEPGLSTSMENDIHIFRLADIYLMKAEALLRSGGSAAEAADLMNAVRARAFPGRPDKLYSTVTLDDVYNERRYEFAWEGFTRQDMIRFGTFLSPRTPFKPYQSDSKYLLYPIPQSAIDANNKLLQNLGY